jgi:3D-(3,5/4)-trihydroxycyclohexane-1,2-dione acylhydrolase (decyclizing)
MPGDLHKLWRTRDPKSYHVEYGFSCMGYEIPGALGVKLAAPEREVFAMVGDGSYLMLGTEIVTAVQEGIKLIIVMVDNHGFSSIGGLSRSLGMDGFGTQYRFRKDGSIGRDSEKTPGAALPIDLTANAASLGAQARTVKTIDELRAALVDARQASRTCVITIEVDRYEGVPAYDSWWEVPIAEVSTVESVRAARHGYETAKATEQPYLGET